MVEKDIADGMRKSTTQWAEENIEKILHEGRNKGTKVARKSMIDEDRFSVDARRKDLGKNTTTKKLRMDECW